MEQGVLIAITVVVVVLVAGAAAAISVYLYLKHKRTKRKYDESLLYAEAQQSSKESKSKAKKTWKQRLITRKTINYPSTEYERLRYGNTPAGQLRTSVARSSSAAASVKYLGPTNRFASPASQGEIRAEPVQPDALQPGTKINQQLRYSDPQKQPLMSSQGSTTDDELGGVDISQYQSLLGYTLESADNFKGEPQGKNHHLGSILFALKYDFENQNLELRIVRCHGLLAKDVGGTSDPYVKAVITPGSKKYYLETKIKMKTLFPEWRETFFFEGFPLSKLESKTLVLQVLDFDRFSKDDPIGEVEVQLGQVNFYEPNVFNLYLSPCTGDRRGLGELMVSLSYNEETGLLTVIIVKARNLKAKDINGLSDPYVKIYSLFQSQRVDKKKTNIKMRDLNPTFNESFQFAIPRYKLKDSGLHIIVMDYDKWGKNDLIGEVILSSRSGTQEIRHWNEALYKQKQMVSEWHALKKIKTSRTLRTSSSTQQP